MPGTVYTDHGVFRRGAAPASVPAGALALYAKTDGVFYVKDAGGTEVAVLTSSVAESDKVLDDNTASAWTVRESTNVYLDFTTTDGAEVIQLGDSGDVAALRVQMEAGTGGWDLTSAGQGIIDAAGVLELNSSGGVISIGNDAVNQNINLGTAGDRAIAVGASGGSTSVTVTAGSGGLALVSEGDGSLSVVDDSATAWRVKQGSDNYILIDTANGGESVQFGNASTNPNYNFLGSGTLSGEAAQFTGSFALTGGSTSYYQSGGPFQFNVSGSAFDIAKCSQFAVETAGGAANSVHLDGGASGGFDFDIGSNGWTIDSGGAIITTIPDNAATQWQVKEGANSYIKVDTTNGSEQVEVGEDLNCLKEITTTHGITSGLTAEVGGTTFLSTVVSATISNTVAETAFGVVSGTFPASTFLHGRWLQIFASGHAINADTGTQPITFTLELYSTTGPTAVEVFELVVADINANDIWEFNARFHVRNTGSSGALDAVAHGGHGCGAAGTMTLARDQTLWSGTFDETKAYYVRVTAQWTNAHADNQVVLDELIVELN